jgi:hypothetical protein
VTARLRVTVLLATVSLFGCATSVDVPAASGGATCRELVNRLPTTVAAAKQRGVTPADSGTAAWGDPAITFRCGVAAPAGFAGGTQLLQVDTVLWLPEKLTAGYRFTAKSSAGYVEVDVPAHYSPVADVLVDLGPAVAASPGTDG